MLRTFKAAALTMAIALTICLVLCGSVYSYADSSSDTGSRLLSPVTIEMKAEHIIKGVRNLKDKEYTFILTSEEPGNPMPEGASGDTLEVRSHGEKNIDFGSISIDHPGTYYYKVKQKGKEKSYRVMLAIFNDGTSDIVIWNETDGGKADRMKFTDEYRSTPKTGDPVSKKRLILTAGAGLVSFAALILMLLMKRKEREI